MKKKNIICALAIAGILSSGLVSCGGEADKPNPGPGPQPTEKTKLKVWAPVEHQEVYKGFVSGFKQENPNYKDVEFELGTCGEGDAYGQVSKDVEGAADVYSFANDQLYNLINVGALAQIGGENKTFVEQNNVQSTVDAAKNLKGELYAYPMSADNGYFLYYNSDVVTNYNEKTSFAEVAEQCAAKNKKFVVPMGDSWYGYGMFAGFGAKYEVKYDDKGKESQITCDYNKEKGLKTGNFMIDLANTEGFQYADGGSSGDKAVVLNDYISKNIDNIGAVIVGTWKYNEISEHWGAEKTKCTYMPLMDKNDSTSRMRSFVGGKMIGVNKTSKNLKIAHDFAKYITSTACQLTRFEKLSVGPSNLQAMEDEKVKANVALNGLAEQVSKAGDAQINVPSTFWTAVQNFGASVGFTKEITKDNLQEKLNGLVTDITTIVK